MDFPSNLFYTREHEWVRFEEGNTATVGITEHAQSELGDIVYVDIEVEGETFNSDEEFGSIEAVKTVSDLFMPITGTVTEINKKLEDNPELVNQDPYGEGWLIKISIADDVDKSSLMSSEEYQAEVGA
ncbi:MAG: glycine cleavage system protein GcvH [Chitinophagales bacterium]